MRFNLDAWSDAALLAQQAELGRLKSCIIKSQEQALKDYHEVICSYPEIPTDEKGQASSVKLMNEHVKYQAKKQAAINARILQLLGVQSTQWIPRTEEGRLDPNLRKVHE